MSLRHGPSGSRVTAGWKFSAGRVDECPETQPSCLHVTPNQ